MIKLKSNEKFFKTLEMFDDIVGTEVGVFSDGSTYSDNDLTTADSALIQELGSDKLNIPSRPFISDEYFDKIDYIESELIHKLFVNTPFEIIDKINPFLKDEMKSRIDNSKKYYEHNAPLTIQMKGFDLPLFETGKMQSDIDSKIKKG